MSVELAGYYEQSYPPSVYAGLPPKLSLTIPDLDLAIGDSDVSQDTGADEGGGTVEHVTGKITIQGAAAAGAKASDVTMRMPDFSGPGRDMTVTFTVDGDDLVGAYGAPGGFTFTPGQHGHTVNHWSLTAASTLTPDDYAVTTRLLDAKGTELTSATWVLTVEPKATPPAPEPAPDPDPAPAPDPAPGPAYDPGEHTIAEVRDYVQDHPAEFDAIYAAELHGKKRTSLLGWLEGRP